MPGNWASPRSFLKMSIRELCSKWVDPLSWRSSLTWSPSWIEVEERKKKWGAQTRSLGGSWALGPATSHNYLFLPIILCWEATGDGKANWSPWAEHCSDMRLLSKQRYHQAEHAAAAPEVRWSRREEEADGKEEEMLGGRGLPLAKNLYCKVQNTFWNFLTLSSSQTHVVLSRTHPNKTKEARNILIRMLLVSHNPCMSKDLCVLLISFIVNRMLF